MISRHDSLERVLGALEAGALSGASVVVVNRGWWGELSAREQNDYRARAERAGVELRADDSLSSHFVEVRGPTDGPALSGEHPV
jgi:hypothetical protein